MSTIVFATIGIIHVFIFVLACCTFYFFYDKQGYRKSDFILFLGVTILSSLVGFLFANHYAFLSKDSSLLLSVGYACFPIAQGSMLLLSYPAIQLIKYKYSIRYAPIFLGIVASAPVSLLLVVSFAQFYWDFLGKNIYGR